MKASISGGGWGAEFSASADYKHVQQGSSAHKLVYTHSEAQCCAYQAKILTYTPPKLHPNFVAGVRSLTVVYQPDVYFKFISAFGTHYAAEIDMGALFGQQTSFQTTAWQKMISEGLDIKAAASYSGFGVTAAASAETATQKKMADSFNKAALSGMVSLVCPKPTSSGAWFVNSRLSLQGQQTVLNGTRSVQYASESSSNILHDSWRLVSSSINELTACRPVLLAPAGYWDRGTL